MFKNYKGKDGRIFRTLFSKILESISKKFKTSPHTKNSGILFFSHKIKYRNFVLWPKKLSWGSYIIFQNQLETTF
jgi:hypothetical protein